MSLNGAAAMYGGGIAATASGGLGLVSSKVEAHHFGAIHDFMVMLDFSALDAVYAVTAILGFIVAVLGFMDTRRKNRAARERDAAIKEWLKNSANHDSSRAPQVITRLRESLEEGKVQ